MNDGDRVQMAGRFAVECRNPDGSLAWREEFSNGTTTAGLNNILSVMFGGGTQTATWYLGLIDNGAFSSLAAADTMSSHSGWAEFVSYSESTRQAWVEGSPAGGILNTTTAATFTMNGAGTLRGAFLTSSSTKSGTTGTLWATGLFGATQDVVSGQTIQVSYTCTATGS
jgi:hypothetical protein